MRTKMVVEKNSTEKHAILNSIRLPENNVTLLVQEFAESIPRRALQFETK